MNRRAALVWLAFGAAACREHAPPVDVPQPTLTEAASADDSGSCMFCHQRQYAQWVGSSHNYGQGLDPIYQALELTANYYATHALQTPLFRRTLLCVTCHAPTAGSFIDGQLNPNASFRAAVEGLQRELRDPADDDDFLLPLGRATEEQVDNTAALADLYRRRRITFQGITCDSCHKVGRPFDDLADEDAGAVCREDTRDCVRQLRLQCEERDDPRCRRISRGGHPHDEDVFERGIANFALVFERDGDVRYGPFAEGHVATNIAHGVSSGSTEEARQFLVSFPGEAEDRRPYMQTSQFCGACHDVRLPIDNPLTPEVELEPIHEEPFMRLENLYTEWFTSALNLHPDADPRDNPYVDEAGNPRRVVCQDCHMSLYPYAPPGVYPGDYTSGADMCDSKGTCGQTIAAEVLDGEPTTLANLKVNRRARVTTHNMTGVDIAMGNLAPDKWQLGIPPDESLPHSVSLPFQTIDDAATDKDPIYGLPMSLDRRRVQQLKNAVTVSLAGTPESVAGGDRDCRDGSCCDAAGNCNLPVKVWLTNVNGGHNIAAGFSQERQLWVELTVQDLGQIEDGRPKVVDCAKAGLSDLYGAETVEGGRYPRWAVKSHTALSANEAFNRFFGYDAATGEAHHQDICRGLSGHLMDKPHDETSERVADGSLDDEDVWLHRIGNTVPELNSGKYLLSWHVVDSGLDAGQLADRPDGHRVARADQYHIAGQNAFLCELSGKQPTSGLGTMPIEVLDPVTGRTSTSTLDAQGGLRWRVTETSDERLEILYPFPEFEPLLPHFGANDALIGGDRFGLVYTTNIFYRVCGCPRPDGSSCEGPKELLGQTAQVPWLATYPTLPHVGESLRPDTLHFPVDRHYYDGALAALGMADGVSASEAFTFVPLNPNHMPNNRSLRFYKPQRHYYDIRFNAREVKGPLRVAVKVWFRHFPPEFLRLMARTTNDAYRRAEGLQKAQEYFPHGPLVVEGELAQRFPNAGQVDNVRRVLLDEAVFFVGVSTAASALTMAVENPSYATDVAPIVADHCLPCHSDVLRHGGLVLSYDAYPQWDDPARGPKVHAHQDPLQNLIGVASKLRDGATLVVPGDPDRSFFVSTLVNDAPSARVRRMPVSTDKLSAREIDTIRNWIREGAKP